MTALWLAGFSCLAVASLLLLPIIFEREVLGSRRLSALFRLKFSQHLFPGDRDRNARAYRAWLPHKEAWDRVTPETIGRKVRSIRELTGTEIANHPDALALGGKLINEIAVGGLVPLRQGNVIRPRAAGEIIAWLIGSGGGGGLEFGNELRSRLKEEPVDLEQVVELVLAAIELLQSRIPRQ